MINFIQIKQLTEFISQITISSFKTSQNDFIQTNRWWIYSKRLVEATYAIPTPNTSRKEYTHPKAQRRDTDNNVTKINKRLMITKEIISQNMFNSCFFFHANRPIRKSLWQPQSKKHNKTETIPKYRQLQTGDPIHKTSKSDKTDLPQTELNHPPAPTARKRN